MLDSKAFWVLALAPFMLLAAGCGLAGLGSTAGAIYAVSQATEEAETETVYPPEPTIVLTTIAQAGPEAGRVTALGGTGQAGGSLWAGTHRGGLFEWPGGGATTSWTLESDGFDRNLTVTAIAVDPTNANSVMVATGRYYAGGVYRTTNGGTSWEAANTGLDSLDVRALIPLPNTTPTAFLAGTSYGIYRTDDGGDSWTVVVPVDPTDNQGLENLGVSALAVNPADEDDIYAATRGGGVYRTTDGGTTWTQASSGLTDLDITALTYYYDATPTHTLYAGTKSTGVFVSTDQGANWSATGTSSPLADEEVLCLAVDPNDATRVFAGTPAGLQVTTDSGASWTLPAGTDPSDSRIVSLLVDENDSDDVYAGGYSGGFFLSNDATTAENFAAENTGLEAAVVRAVEADLNDANRYYAGGGYAIAGGSSMGIRVTGDAGTTWSPPAGTSPTVGNIAALASHPDVAQDLYAAVEGSGVWYSTDGGNNWTQEWTASAPDDALAIEIVDTTGSDTLLAGCDAYAYTTGTADFTGGSAVVTGTSTSWTSSPIAAGWEIRLDAAGTWYTVLTVDSATQITLDANVAAVDEGSGDYAARGPTGAWRSTDGGTTWSAVTGLPAGASVRDFAVEPGSTTVVYAATDSGVYASADGGATWTAATTSPSFTRGTTSYSTTNAVLVDPVDATVVYAGTAGGGVFKSQDAGDTFSAANLHIEGGANVIVYEMVAHGGATPYVYVATNVGLYRTADQASAWNPVHDDSTAFTTEGERRILVGRALALNPNDTSELWVGTEGRGILTVTVP